MSIPTKDHFKGKSVPSHLKEARIKGAKTTEEVHGLEISGQKAAFYDALRDASLAAVLIVTPAHFFLPPPMLTLILSLFLLGWTLWKTCRSACLGWARLGKLHRVIEEERWEIEHNRPQEREELIAIYEARGFSGILLTQTVDVLMADDNRLLQVMLDEELGLPLESYEHPLQQALGAFLGAVIPTILAPFLYFFSPFYIFIGIFLLFFIGGGLFMAKLEKNSLLTSFVWSLSLFALCIGIVYYLTKAIFL